MENTLPENSPPQMTPQSQLTSPTSSRTLNLVIVGLLIALPMVGVGAYYFGKQNIPTDPNPIVITPTPVANTDNDNQVACTMEAKICPDGSAVGRSGPNCEFEPCPSPAVQRSSANKLGWMKYEDKELGVSFEYPVDQIEVKLLDSTNPTGIRDISLLSKKTKDLSGRFIELLTFSDTYNPRTYGDQNTPESIDPAKYIVQGKKYDAWNFVMGEGNPCGGGNLKTATVRLRENLIIYKTNINQQRNKDQVNCAGDQYNEFNTPAADLLLADKIISTIEFKE